MAGLGFILKRSFSSSSVASQLVKTPIQVFGIEGRYATALYSAASKQKKLEAVEKEVHAIKKLNLEDKKFHNFFMNPTYKRTEKRGAMQAILKKLGYSDISQNFFTVIAENGRLAKLDKIIKSFEQLMSAHRGEVICEIISAKPLDANTAKELTVSLQSFVKSNEKVNVLFKVNPEIVGGLIVTVGDKYVDMSIATKLKNYHKLLAQAF